MNELLASDKFNTYHKKLIGMMNSHISMLMNQEKYVEMGGAIKLAKLVIDFPVAITSNDEVKQKVLQNKKLWQSNFLVRDK